MGNWTNKNMGNWAQIIIHLLSKNLHLSIYPVHNIHYCHIYCPNIQPVKPTIQKKKN